MKYWNKTQVFSIINTFLFYLLLNTYNKFEIVLSLLNL